MAQGWSHWFRYVGLGALWFGTLGLLEVLSSPIGLLVVVTARDVPMCGARPI